MKPRLRAEWVVFREIFCSLKKLLLETNKEKFSFWGRQKSYKSSKKRAAAERHGDMVCSNVHRKDERKRKVVCHRRI